MRSNLKTINTTTTKHSKPHKKINTFPHPDVWYGLRDQKLYIFCKITIFFVMKPKSKIYTIVKDEKKLKNSLLFTTHKLTRKKYTVLYLRVEDLQKLLHVSRSARPFLKKQSDLCHQS